MWCASCVPTKTPNPNPPPLIQMYPDANVPTEQTSSTFQYLEDCHTWLPHITYKDLAKWEMNFSKCNTSSKKLLEDCRSLLILCHIQLVIQRMDGNLRYSKKVGFFCHQIKGRTLNCGLPSGPFKRCFSTVSPGAFFVRPRNQNEKWLHHQRGDQEAWSLERGRLRKCNLELLTQRYEGIVVSKSLYVHEGWKGKYRKTKRTPRD